MPSVLFSACANGFETTDGRFCDEVGQESGKIFGKKFLFLILKFQKASYGDVIFADHLAKFEQKPAVFESEKEIKEEVVVEDEVSEDLSNPVVCKFFRRLKLLFISFN